MLEKMSEMIAEQLNCEAGDITAETSFKDDLGADSLDLFELVMDDANPYVINKANDVPVSDELMETLDRELLLMEEISLITPEEIYADLSCNIELPKWKVEAFKFR